MQPRGRAKDVKLPLHSADFRPRRRCTGESRATFCKEALLGEARSPSLPGGRGNGTATPCDCRASTRLNCESGRAEVLVAERPDPPVDRLRYLLALFAKEVALSESARPEATAWLPASIRSASTAQK